MGPLLVHISTSCSSTCSSSMRLSSRQQLNSSMSADSLTQHSLQPPITPATCCQVSTQCLCTKSSRHRFPSLLPIPPLLRRSYDSSRTRTADHGSAVVPHDAMGGACTRFVLQRNILGAGFSPARAIWGALRSRSDATRGMASSRGTTRGG